jgi:glucosamine--fructose-6-phosphate aminotransferase (isomerizing)
VPITPQIRELEFDLEQIDLGAFEHYMLKEIMEQPQALRLCLKGRIDTRAGQVVLGGISQFARDLVKARRIIFVGQGTALHAAMVGEYLMEDLAKIPSNSQASSGIEIQSSKKARWSSRSARAAKRPTRLPHCWKASNAARWRLAW